MIFNDEMLSAYLDGELNDVQNEQLESALEHDETLRERLESFAAVDTFLQDGLSHIDSDYSEEAYTQIITPTAQNASNHRNFRVLALAACALFVVGIGTILTSNLLAPRQGSAPVLIAQSLAQDHALYTLLENTLSANTIALDVNAELRGKVVLSFQNQDGAFCRHFQVEQTGKTYEGVGCRSRQNWAVKLIAETADQPDPATYKTASTSGSEAVESLIDEIITGLPLTLEDEKIQIQSEWSNSKP